MALSLGNSNLRSPMSFYPYGQFTSTANFLFFWYVCTQPIHFLFRKYLSFSHKNFWRNFSRKIFGEIGETLMRKYLKEKILRKIKNISEEKLLRPI